MAITDADISQALAAYLERYPEETTALSEPLRTIAGGGGFASRRSFPMHVTVGALLVRGGRGILLIEHRAYGITLQPGGHEELPTWKQEHNRSHKQVRARAEHAFAPMKTWKIFRDCRLKGEGVHHAVLGIAHLHNLVRSTGLLPT